MTVKIFMNDFIKINNDAILIFIKAVPGSSVNEFAGIRDKRLCVRIAAAPQDNKANNCLRDFLAKTLRCPKRDILLISGEKSRLKTVSVPVSCTQILKEITSSL